MWFSASACLEIKIFVVLFDSKLELLSTRLIYVPPTISVVYVQA